MKTSDQLDKIAPALLASQKAVTHALKDSTNPHFRSKYADVSAVIEAVKEPLNANGISFLQSPSPSEDGRLPLTTRLLHTSGQWIEDTAVCPLPKADPQGFGSALTYLRRYSLGAIMGVPAEDDDGEGAVHRSAVTEKPKATNVESLPPSKAMSKDTEKQLRFLAGAPKTRSFVEQVMKAKGYSDIAEIPEETATKAISWIESQMKTLGE